MPRESGQYVAERSRDVFVDEEGVKKVAEMLYTLRDSEAFTASGWKMMNSLAPSPDTDEAINWVFVTDTMNFSFWPDREDQQCEVKYKETTYRGYMSLCAAVTRAMDEGKWSCGRHPVCSFAHSDEIGLILTRVFFTSFCHRCAYNRPCLLLPDERG